MKYRSLKEYLTKNKIKVANKLQTIECETSLEREYEKAYYTSCGKRSIRLQKNTSKQLSVW